MKLDWRPTRTVLMVRVHWETINVVINPKDGIPAEVCWIDSRQHPLSGSWVNQSIYAHILLNILYWGFMYLEPSSRGADSQGVITEASWPVSRCIAYIYTNI